MKISARNQLPGTVVAIERDGVTAEVTIDVGGGKTIVAVITRASAESLGLDVGSSVVAVIKSTDVMVATP